MDRAEENLYVFVKTVAFVDMTSLYGEDTIVLKNVQAKNIAAKKNI